MSKTNKLDTVLEKLGEFIKSLSPRPSFSGTFFPQIFFSGYEDETIFLNDMEAKRYRECLRELIKIATAGEQISPKAVDSLCKEAILESLDINERRSNQPLEQRIAEAIKKLKTSLRESPRPFKVYYPIGGLAADGLPLKVGNVTFDIFGDEHLAELKGIPGRQERREEERRIIDEGTEGIVGEPICIIEVEAIDADAGISLALNEVRLTIDIINFYSDLLTHSMGHLFIIGEAEKSPVTIAVLDMGDKPIWHLQEKPAGPFVPLSLEKLQSLDARVNRGFTAVSNILSSNCRTELQERLVAAMQWAGRATVDRRKEEAFLLYAIALESLILSEDERGAIRYRLKFRVSHLLGKDLSNRSDLYNDVHHLYDIRCDIVHSGSYQVTDADLYLIKYLAKSSILRILVDEPFTSMSRPDDLAAWFKEQISK